MNIDPYIELLESENIRLKDENTSLRYRNRELADKLSRCQRTLNGRIRDDFERVDFSDPYR